jgi:hypothetical protein
LLDVMCDLETMDTTLGAAIVAIGAVEFDLNKVEIGRQFYITLDLTSAIEYGLRMDPDTIKWWMRQDEKVQRAVARPQADMYNGLQMFAGWLSECGPTNEIKVWGNDPAFDNGMLQLAFKAARVEQPWKFWNNRCLRTYRSLWPSIEADARQGTHHNALDDALYQAEHMLKIRRVLNERRGV